jgi:pimeloyl-ACP methyl ester carboxylesterase
VAEAGDRQHDQRGLSSCSCSTEKPSRSSTPVRKFSTSTSACRTSRVSVARPSSDFRSSAIDSLLRLQDRKYVDSRASSGPTKGGPQAAGVVAGAGRLDLDHAAPEVAEHHRRVRPASARLRSTTTVPLSGPLPLTCRTICPGRRVPAADTVRAEVDATAGRATGHHGAVQQPTVSYVDVGPVRLAYESFGDPSHPLVLLLMGQGTQMLAWADPFCTRLAERGLHVVRFDNRDIGLSTHLPRKGLRQYTLDDLAGDTLGLLDALGVRRAHLVGLSMGGMIAQLVAIGAPERVLSMTCIGSSTGSRRVGRPKPALLRRLPLRRSVSDRDGAGELFARIIAAIGSPAYPGDPERLRDLGARAFDRGSHPRGALRQLLAVIRAPDRTPWPPSRAGAYPRRPRRGRSAGARVRWAGDRRRCPRRPAGHRAGHGT